MESLKRSDTVCYAVRLLWISFFSRHSTFNGRSIQKKPRHLGNSKLPLFRLKVGFMNDACSSIPPNARKTLRKIKRRISLAARQKQREPVQDEREIQVTCALIYSFRAWFIAKFAKCREKPLQVRKNHLFWWKRNSVLLQRSSVELTLK